MNLARAAYVAVVPGLEQLVLMCPKRGLARTTLILTDQILALG